jgi:ABC-type multidrug transport system fused ATPase/permease subunit
MEQGAMVDQAYKTIELSRDLYAFVWKESQRQQLVICLLTMVLAPLMMVPLEIQRRIVNDALVGGNFSLLVWLCLTYLGIILLQGSIKFGLNMVKGMAVEAIARDIRQRIVGDILDRKRRHGAVVTHAAAGTVVSMLAAETEDVSGFGGEALGLPLLTGATIFYVVAYLLWVEPVIAIVAVVIYLPQALIVPLTQNSINRLARLRIVNVRSIGRIAAGLAPSRVTGRVIIHRIYRLRVAIYVRKYALAALGNFLDALGPIIVLSFGGYLVINGMTQVGTLLVFISGLNKIADPWDQLVNFYRSVSNTAVAYDMIRGQIESDSRRDTLKQTSDISFRRDEATRAGL